MANLKKTNIGNKPKDDDLLVQSVKTDPTLSDDQESSHSEHGRKKTDHSGPLKKSTIQKKYNQAKIANWIAGVAVCVSIVLAIFTYSLFKQASNQTVVANKSAAAAVTADSIANNSYHLSDSIYKASAAANKITLAETKRYDDGFLRSQKAVFDENKKIADRNEAREKISFQETKNEFEIENRPYFQIVNINIDTLERGKPLYISYYFNNYGKFPANVLSVKSQISYSVDQVLVIPPSFNNYTNSKTNFYIANGVSQKLNTFGVDTLPKDFVEQYKKGNISLFLFGYCEFINPITSKKFIYKFKNRINTKPSFTIEIQENSVQEEK